LKALKCYIDDNFSFSRTSDLEFYEKYKAFWPSDQIKLLQLWDEIGFPHEEDKQISGFCIPIIGFKVNPNAMMVTMSTAKQSELILACNSSTVCRARKTLRKFQRLQGWINWALNVYPHLCPALCQSYHKIFGKSQPRAPIQVNNTI
jgi:hypothetical protein